LDRGLFEYFGPLGISRFVASCTKANSYLQSGFIYNYAFTIFIFLTLILSSLGSFYFLSSHSDLFLLFLPIFFFLSL
jgi:hypothetical protein